MNRADGGQEMQQMLADGKKAKIKPKSDAEKALMGTGSFDPFEERKLPHPTTDNETLVHLLKSALGTGILGMPIAFMYAGIAMGVFATILTAFVCTHCAYVLVQCAHVLYYKTHRTSLSFAEIAQISFENGPKCVRPLAGLARFCVLFGLFLTYFGTCSVYAVIIARNLEQVLEHWIGANLNTRMLIAALLIPCILLCWIPNLKYLVPVSFIANICMFIGLGITFYYIVTDLPPITNCDYAQITTLPLFFAITIFAMEAIGVVMPLENNMETPRNFLGICGVLSRGMTVVALIYMSLGFLGYWKYGAETEESITLNLPVNELPAQIVKLAIAIAVFGTFGLQFYVALEIVWDGIKDNYTKRPTLAKYVLRTVLVTAAILVAIAVPTIAPFMGLIGAFCFSLLGLIFPVVIEILTFWEIGFGRCNWRIWKNVFIIIFGILALIFGTWTAVRDIIKVYGIGS